MDAADVRRHFRRGGERHGGRGTFLGDDLGIHDRVVVSVPDVEVVGRSVGVRPLDGVLLAFLERQGGIRLPGDGVRRGCLPPVDEPVEFDGRGRIDAARTTVRDR